MKIVVCKDYDDVSRVMAEKVVEQIRKKPNLVFCLPAGNSPIGMYKYLVQMYKEGKADFSQLRTFDMDEYAGLTPDGFTQLYLFYASALSGSCQYQYG